MHYLSQLLSPSCVSYPTKISFPLPNMLDKSMKILSILHWNISSTGTAQNGNFVYLYLPNDMRMWLDMMIFLSGPKF